MREMTTRVVFLAAAVIVMAACGGGKGKPMGTADPDVIVLTGTIRFFALEGDFFAIRADDGKTYDPINLPPDYQKDGLRVRVRARLRADMLGVHMVGPIIEILSIDKV
jgi:hypothetical protein